MYVCLSSSSEIPQFRLPYDVVSFEIELMKDLGVKVCDLFATVASVVVTVFNDAGRLSLAKGWEMTD